MLSLIITIAFVILVIDGMMRNGLVYLNAVIGKNGMEDNVNVLKDVEDTIINVDNVQQELRLTEKNAFANTDINGITENGHVFLNAEIGKNGMEKSVFVQMDVVDMEENAKSAQVLLQHTTINVFAHHNMNGMKSNGDVSLVAMRNGKFMMGQNVFAEMD